MSVTSARSTVCWLPAFSARVWMRCRSNAACSDSSVDRSRSNSLSSSGESILASGCPLLTLSPALTLVLTVPAVAAYNVGETAATTWPCTATSETKRPRVTVA